MWSPRHAGWHCLSFLLLVSLGVQFGIATPALSYRSLLQAEAPAVNRTANATGTATLLNGTDAALDAKPKETIAHILDEALKEEFKHEEEKSAEQGSAYNKTAKTSEATEETVIIISSRKDRHANTTADGVAGAGVNSTSTTDSVGTDGVAGSDSSGKAGAGAAAGSGADAGGAGSGDSTAGGGMASLTGSAEADVDRIIDSKDNEYVLSKAGEEGSMGIQLDPRLVKDLTVLIASSALAGGAMEAVGLPIINGYFIAGSAVGPGGLNWVSEPVQVQSLAQLGVQLLLFSLGLEFSLAKLRAVRGVALLGGVLQIGALAALGAGGAATIGAPPHTGAFIGALAAMSSTSIVVKCLSDRRCQHSASGQIVVGTLVMQDCVVGLLFALLPLMALAAPGVALASPLNSGGDAADDGVGDATGHRLLWVVGRRLLQAASGDKPNLGTNGTIPVTTVLEGSSTPPGTGLAWGVLAGVLAQVAVRLAGTAVTAVLAARWLLPAPLALLYRRGSAEVKALASVGLCCCVSLLTTRLGISAELGAFVAGAAVSAAGAGEAMHECVEPLTQFFLALFVSSTGLVLAPAFLLHHLPVLAAGTALLVVVKALAFGAVVLLFGHGLEVAAGVGMALAQVGEFVFVLLSLAHGQDLLPTQVYLLLMGITALSLLVTPFLLQLSMRLGTGSSWLPLPTAELELAGITQRGQRLRQSPPPVSAGLGPSMASNGGTNGHRKGRSLSMSLQGMRESDAV